MYPVNTAGERACNPETHFDHLLGRFRVGNQESCPAGKAMCTGAHPGGGRILPMLRRRFLKSSALAGAGALTIPFHGLAQSKRPIRIVMGGYGPATTGFSL